VAIYKVSIRGTETVRLVKAATAAQARDHIVSADAISAEQMAELIEGGAKLEKAGEPAPGASGGDANNGGENGGGDK
jgi:hypothetical protein